LEEKYRKLRKSYCIKLKKGFNKQKVGKLGPIAGKAKGLSAEAFNLAMAFAFLKSISISKMS